MRTLFVIAAAGVVLSGCNTVAGIGRDMSAVGNAVTGAANDASGSHRTARARSSKTTRTAQLKCTGPRSKDLTGKC
jgi:predicted small secreted protein